MKKLLCPLCGGLLELDDYLFQNVPLGYGRYESRQVYIYQCSECRLSAEYGETPEEARRYAEELISEFPPFMRVYQGDNLKLDFDDDILTVIGKDTDRCKIYLEDCKGNTEIATPDDVDQWPWEIEQKGGSND